MTNIEKAEEAVTHLNETLARTSARLQKIAEEQKAIGYATFVDGDAKARKRLDALHAEAITLVGEITAIESAQVEAKARLESAPFERIMETKRYRAVELRKHAADLKEHGASLDKAMGAVVAADQAFRVALNEIHLLGCDTPTHEQVDTLGRRAMLTHLMATAWKVEHLAPGERQNFAQLAGEWANSINANFVDGFIGEDEQKAA